MKAHNDQFLKKPINLKLCLALFYNSYYKYGFVFKNKPLKTISKGLKKEFKSEQVIFTLGYFVCKKRAKLNSYINPDGNHKDIERLNQLEEKDGHLKSPKRLCNCGVNYIKIITFFT